MLKKYVRYRQKLNTVPVLMIRLKIIPKTFPSEKPMLTENSVQLVLLEKILLKTVQYTIVSEYHEVSEMDYTKFRNYAAILLVKFRLHEIWG